MFSAVRIRHQFPDVSANDFAGSVTEHRFGGSVELFDDAGVIDYDDRVYGRIEKRLERTLRLRQSCRVSGGIKTLFRLSHRPQ